MLKLESHTRALFALVPDGRFNLSWDEANSKVIENWIDGPRPAEDVLQAKITEIENGEGLELLRLERDRRLLETDWMGQADYPITQAWKDYRQALRDLPASASPVVDYDSPDMSGVKNVTWPTKPS